MVHITNWATSALGAPIELYASDKLESLERPLLLMGGVHGDEPLGVLLAQQTLKFVLENEAKIQRPWILIPCLNVDGYKSNTRVNGRGVDLNRNYPSKSWSPEHEKPRYNPGPSPGSEPEIQAVVALIQATRPELIVHCHSWKPMIVCAGDPGLRAAELLSRSTGYEVVPEIGYPTPGSLSQFGWGDNGIPVICIEEADEAAPNSVWPRFEEGMRALFLDATRP
jgi:murein peptide amidase A